MTFNLFFALAEMVYLFGILPNIISILKNRNNLKGFSFYGAILSMSGMILYIIGFFQMDMIINLLITIPSVLYWIVVAYYNRRNKK